MLICCPECQSRYRIDPSTTSTKVAKVKCPTCARLFEVSLVQDNQPDGETSNSALPVILVVDDARFFREMIKDLLKDLPVEVLMAADGEDAWQQIQSAVPSLVLLDLNIPQKSGREILQQLQASPLRDRVRVLAMSAVERGDEVAREVCRIGAADFINKSFKPRELQNRVRSILGL